ncbi:MAG: fused MFS/spermidine synthase [Firmicutes bacterium]|nr:fused MFS/spermidine synthase [Bacillota bacterium]
MDKFRKIILFASVFVCGAGVMIVELVGVRLLAPYFGTAMFVWASIIGVILGAMAFGYHLGGRIADRNATYNGFAFYIGLCATLTILVSVLAEPVLALFSLPAIAPIVGAFISAMILYIPVSIAFGIITPYAIKLSFMACKEEADKHGKIVGNINSIATVGSITGTFLAGFVLIPFLGATTVMVSVAAAIIILAFVVNIKNKWVTQVPLIVMFVIIVVGSFVSYVQVVSVPGMVYRTNTQYNTVTIADRGNVRTMFLGTGRSSARFLDSDDLVFEYTRLYDLAFDFHDNIQTTLMIGGAGYSYPQYFVRNHTGTMDVIEIDPGVTELARRFMGLTDHPRMRIFHRDARIFLNNNEKRYDVIFGDAFVARTPPWHLTTVQAKQRIHASLADDGIYIINIIDRVAGGRLFAAIYHTMARVFPYQLVFRPQYHYTELGDVQNITIMAFKNEPLASGTSEFHYRQYHGTVPRGMILTDDRAPVETLVP